MNTLDFLFSLQYEESEMIHFTTAGRGSISHWPIANLFLALPQDPWEITADDLTIYEDMPLGRGCYGEVYKGVLKGRKQRAGSRKGRNQPRLSLTSIVAVKRLPSEISQTVPCFLIM